MALVHNTILGFVAAVFCANAFAADVNFTGRWKIDLRAPVERKQKLECGTAEFTLKQVGEKIVGSHTFSSVGCGRLNEGGEETVKGIVVGTTAVLVVTSGRNGGMVLGKATRHGNQLQWQGLRTKPR